MFLDSEEKSQNESSTSSLNTIQSRWYKYLEAFLRKAEEEVFLRKVVETSWIFYTLHRTEKSQRMSSYYRVGT